MIGIINSNKNFFNEKLDDYNQVFQNFAGNTGNSLISESVINNFCNRTPYVIVNNLYKNIDRDQIDLLKNCNHLLFIMKDNLRSGQSYAGLDESVFFDNLYKIINSTNCEITILSLGLNHFDRNFPLKDLILEIPTEFIKWLQLIQDRTYKYCTRGYKSAEILELIGIKNTLPLGCPSFFNFRFPEIDQEKINSINNSDLFIFNGIFCNSKSSNHTYVIQDEKILFDLIFGKKVNSSEYEYFKDMSKLYAKDIIDHYKKNKVFFFSDFQSAFEIYNNASLSIGTRIHGGVASLSCGVPTLITNQDMRASEICDFLNIPYFPEYGFSVNSDFGEDIDIPILINKTDFTRYNKSYKEKFENFNNFKKTLLKKL
tara:strand:+ start:1164 stop:2276 length:1113 start_codon:yes stop_codon:yes gene_type:complete